MLNKELMLLNSEELEYTHIIRVGRHFSDGLKLLGMRKPLELGTMMPSTVLINGNPIEMYSLNSVYNYDEYSRLSFTSYWYTPAVDLYLGRTDTRQVLRYFGWDPDAGWIEYSNTSGKPDIKFTEEDVGKDIHLWIATTPPLGHKTPQEHLTEESVDAQQGITVDRWREFRCYGCSEDYTRSRRCSSCNNGLQFTRRAVDVFRSSSTDPTARNCGIHSQGKERCFDRDIWRNKRLGNYESHTKRCGGTHWVDTCKPHPYTRQLHNRGLHDYLLTSQEALYA